MYSSSDWVPFVFMSVTLREGRYSLCVRYSHRSGATRERKKMIKEVKLQDVRVGSCLSSFVIYLRRVK